MAPENLEFHQGKDKGWHGIGEPYDKEVELEVFPIATANGLIVCTLQAENVKMINQDDGSGENLSDPEC